MHHYFLLSMKTAVVHLFKRQNSRNSMAYALPNTPAIMHPNRTNLDRAGHDIHHYTYRSVPVINRTLTVHKHQYSIEKKLGEGGFGEVYAAHRVPDRKAVAIKIVSLATIDPWSAEGLKEAFLNEVSMSKRLAKTSRHIIEMFDFDFHPNGLTFIVMELGQQDLEKALKAKPLSSAERKVAWRQLVSIAMALHSHQIVHLDIKPHNIVVFPGNVIKLVDLGIAQKSTERRIGRTGTIPYSAPEVTTVSHYHQTNNSTKADAWSWGAVLYRMTYHTQPDSNYKSPCDRPPAKQPYSRDPNLRHLLRHTLVVSPAQRPDTPWLAQHPYTKSA